MIEWNTASILFRVFAPIIGGSAKGNFSGHAFEHALGIIPYKEIKRFITSLSK